MQIGSPHVNTRCDREQPLRAPVWVTAPLSTTAFITASNGWVVYNLREAPESRSTWTSSNVRVSPAGISDGLCQLCFRHTWQPVLHDYVDLLSWQQVHKPRLAKTQRTDSELDQDKQKLKVFQPFLVLYLFQMKFRNPASACGLRVKSAWSHLKHRLVWGQLSKLWLILTRSVCGRFEWKKKIVFWYKTKESKNAKKGVNVWNLF